MRLGKRTYRVWEKLELPKYFLNLHVNAPSPTQTDLRHHKRRVYKTRLPGGVETFVSLTL